MSETSGAAYAEHGTNMCLYYKWHLKVVRGRNRRKSYT